MDIHGGACKSIRYNMGMVLFSFFFFFVSMTGHFVAERTIENVGAPELVYLPCAHVGLFNMLLCTQVSAICKALLLLEP